MLEIDDQPVQEAIAEVVHAIQDVRLLGGISKYRLAKLTGLHASTIGLIERGQRNPSLFVILKMAGALEVSLGSILSRCETSLHPEPEVTPTG